MARYQLVKPALTMRPIRELLPPDPLRIRTFPTLNQLPNSLHLPIHNQLVPPTDETQHGDVVAEFRHGDVSVPFLCEEVGDEEEGTEVWDEEGDEGATV